VIWALRRDLTRYHLHDEVARLALPTLVVWGAEDRLLPFAPVPGWVSRLPDGELEVIERCGHMAIIEHPELVAERILRFLSRAPSPNGPRPPRRSSSTNGWWGGSTAS
jgi:pimeloyl-ACP methyl ester carboxylesterase